MIFFQRKALFWVFLILFSVVCVIQDYCEESINDKNWYKYGAEYADLDEIMIQHEIEKKNSAMQDYTNRYNAESKILKLSISPTQGDLMKLLLSNDIKEQKIALVIIRVRKIYSRKLFAEILNLMNSSNDFFVRFYVYQCFDSIGKMKFSYFKEKFFKNFEKEENETLIISGLEILTVIDSEKIIPLFVKYFKTGSIGFKKITYIYFNKLKKNYQDEIRDILKKENIDFNPDDLQREN